MVVVAMLAGTVMVVAAAFVKLVACYFTYINDGGDNDKFHNE